MKIISVIVIALASFFLTGQLAQAQMATLKMPANTKLVLQARAQQMKMRNMLAKCRQTLARLRKVPAKKLSRKIRLLKKQTRKRCATLQRQLKAFTAELKNPQMAQMQLQQMMQRQQQMLHLLTNAMKSMNQARQSVINNMR